MEGTHGNTDELKLGNAGTAPEQPGKEHSHSDGLTPDPQQVGKLPSTTPEGGLGILKQGVPSPQESSKKAKAGTLTFGFEQGVKPMDSPAEPRSRVLNWLGNANNMLTALGATVAAVAAIFSTINKASIARVDDKLHSLDLQVKQLDLRERKEKASIDFADIFLKQVLSDPQLQEKEKHVQALLSIINIVAQSSASGNGESDAKARAIMPLQLALLMGQPGGLAAMDPDYRFLDDWVAMAISDDSSETRVTAIRALSGLCQKALREERLEILWKGVQDVDQLFSLIPESQTAIRASAVAARSQLASFIKKEESFLENANLPKDDRRDPKTLRTDIRNAFADASILAQNTRSSLQATYAKLEDSTKRDAGEAVFVKNSIGQLDAALQTAAQITVEKVIETAKSDEHHGPSSSEKDLTESAIIKIIPDLTSENADKRRKARSDLALFGQNAVKPLLDEVQKRDNAKSAQDDAARLGVAVALQSMRRSIVLDQADADRVVSLLRSNDNETRHATAEFLMNLENDSSVRHCFEALEKLFYKLSDSPEGANGNTVVNIATIVGTWARNLTRDTESREPGKPFPTFALEAAKTWREVLQHSKSQSEWTQTIGTLDELIGRAKKSSKTSTGP